MTSVIGCNWGSLGSCVRVGVRCFQMQILICQRIRQIFCIELLIHSGMVTHVGVYNQLQPCP